MGLLPPRGEGGLEISPCSCSPDGPGRGELGCWLCTTAADEDDMGDSAMEGPQRKASAAAEELVTPMRCLLGDDELLEDSRPEDEEALSVLTLLTMTCWLPPPEGRPLWLADVLWLGQLLPPLPPLPPLAEYPEEEGCGEKLATLTTILAVDPDGAWEDTADDDDEAPGSWEA
jgi:hypothetical protein